MSKKVIIGLSGGVDSSVAALLLKEQGYDVTGAFMQIWDGVSKSETYVDACYSPNEIKDIEDAQKISDKLNIPLKIINLSIEYKMNVLEYFKTNYIQGLTPNPCVICNRNLKFGLLFYKTMRDNLKDAFFATGHYANVDYNKATGRYLLRKGKDANKDQTYFLSMLSQDQLAKIIFPLGTYTKDDVRVIATKNNLITHNKKESQDFYSGDYTELFDELPGQGDIIDKTGNILGKHKGICHYTIGQRKGLGISNPTPLYVLEIDSKRNLIIVGNEEDLYSKEVIVGNMNWIYIDNLNEDMKVKVKLRYRHRESSARISGYMKDKVKILFDNPQRAVTPGQFAVIYKNDYVIGAGTIIRKYKK